jgi:hypothetical protein
VDTVVLKRLYVLVLLELDVSGRLSVSSAQVDLTLAQEGRILGVLPTHRWPAQDSQPRSHRRMSGLRADRQFGDRRSTLSDGPGA